MYHCCSVGGSLLPHLSSPEFSLLCLLVDATTRRSYTGSGSSFSGRLASMSRAVCARDGAGASEVLHDSEGEGGGEGDLGPAHSGGTVRSDISPKRERANERTSTSLQSTIKQPAAPCLPSSRRFTLPRYHRIMCSSMVRRKNQKFNSKSAEVTSTMLIMAVFGILTPTPFYQIYGNVRPFLSAVSPLKIAFELGSPQTPPSHSLNAETNARCSLGVQAVLQRLL